MASGPGSSIEARLASAVSSHTFGGVTDPISPQASDLCTACGMCCAGPVFNSIDLQPDELDLAESLGLPFVTDTKGAPGFSFPCPCLSGTACTVYEIRPSGCRSFRCLLLKRLDRGEVPLFHALELVETAREAVRLVEAELGAETIPQYRYRRAEALIERGEALPHTPARDRLNELDAILDLHFRPAHQNQTTPFDGVEGRESWVSVSMGAPDPA